MRRSEVVGTITTRKRIASKQDAPDRCDWGSFFAFRISALFSHSAPASRIEFNFPLVLIRLLSYVTRKKERLEWACTTAYVRMKTVKPLSFLLKLRAF